MKMRALSYAFVGLLALACGSSTKNTSSSSTGGHGSQGGTGGQGGTDDGITLDKFCSSVSNDAGVDDAGANGASMDALVQQFQRGINLGNRLDAPTEGAWGPVLRVADFPLVAQRGFDHIRLPVRFSAHADSAAPYTVDPTFLARVDWAVAHALNSGLSVLVDMHHYLELMTDPTGNSARFLGLWDQIATHYKDCPNTVAFELLNEPSEALDSEWNVLLAQGLDVVRRTNPSRLVVIDGPNYSEAASINLLDLPDDPYIMTAVHTYEPSLFLFQGQTWMTGEYYTTGIVYPGPPATLITPVPAAQAIPWVSNWFAQYNTLPSDQNPCGISTVNAQVAAMDSYRTTSGHPIYNGEWGPQNGADPDSRGRYMKDLREACESRHIGWAVWEDQTGMQLYKASDGTWLEPMTSALFP